MERQKENKINIQKSYVLSIIILYICNMKSLKYLKEITILGRLFSIEYNKEHDGGSVDLTNQIIEIGTYGYSVNSQKVFDIISHELFEIIFEYMGAIYSNNRRPEEYVFHFTHQTFENAVSIHSEAFMKFIK